MLREACRQVAVWRDAGLGIVRVAVNVSYRQFVGEDLAEGVWHILDEFHLPGAALELEFTERVLIEDAPDTLRTFADLREMGVILTIDDFGEGYSASNSSAPTADPRLEAEPAVRRRAYRTTIPRCRVPGGVGDRAQPRLGLVAEGVWYF